jgi:hypothetical protein
MVYDRDINFECAKLAKQKGFPQRHGDGGGYDATGDYCGDFALDIINGRECYRIATQGELVAFLRIVHGLHILGPFAPQYMRWDGSIFNLVTNQEVFRKRLYTVGYVEFQDFFILEALKLCPDTDWD